MLATSLATFSYRQSNLPSEARTPTAARLVRVMKCRTSPTCATIGDEYPAPSPIGDFQTTLPVFLSSATIVASRAPGVTIRFSPSTKGDSLYAQCGIEAPKSFWKFTLQILEPS